MIEQCKVDTLSGFVSSQIHLGNLEIISSNCSWDLLVSNLKNLMIELTDTRCLMDWKQRQMKMKENWIEVSPLLFPSFYENLWYHTMILDELKQRWTVRRKNCLNGVTELLTRYSFLIDIYFYIRIILLSLQYNRVHNNFMWHVRCHVIKCSTKRYRNLFIVIIIQFII